jgi:cytochrome P450
MFALGLLLSVIICYTVWYYVNYVKKSVFVIFCNFFELISFFSLFSLFQFLITFSRFFQIFKSSGRPKGPLPLPFIGNLLLMFGEDPTLNLANLFDQCGGEDTVEIIDFLGRSFLVTRDPEIYKQVMRNEKLLNRRYDVDENLDKLGMLEKGVLMNNNPITWKHHRGLILKAVNSSGFLNDAARVLNELFKENFEKVLENSTKRDVTDLKRFFKDVFMDLQEKLVFSDMGEPAEERRHIAEYVEYFFEAWCFYMQYPPIALKFFPRWIIRKHDERIQKFAKYQIKEIEVRVRAFKEMSSDEIESSNDFIIRLLKHNKEEQGEDLKLEEIRAILNDLYLGLTDTSINTLAGAFYHLSGRLDVQDKLRLEVKAFFKKHDEVTRLNVGELEYLNAFVLECFRFQSTVPFVSRVVDHDGTKVGPYSVEKGSTIILMTSKLHTNPKIWQDFEAFNPERFLGSEGKEKMKLVYPFGGGRRSCPGQALGMLGVKMCIALMIRNFKFTSTASNDHLKGKNLIVFNVAPESATVKVQKL